MIAYKPSPVCVLPWVENPYRLVNLWDIVRQFNVFALAGCLHPMVALKVTCDGLIEDGKGGDSPSDWLREQSFAVLQSAFDYCGAVGFVAEAEGIQRIGMRMSNKLDVSTVRHCIASIEDYLLDAMKRSKFIRPEAGLDAYVDNASLFGEIVSSNFPDAMLDATACGNCLAVGLNTAAVFHLMRVAEYGLRMIAANLNVTLVDKGKPQPIEHAEWQKILTAINNKIDAAKALQQGPVKSGAIGFYKKAADYCTYLQDERNTVAHARKDYNPGEALGVLERVRHFMAFLAAGPPDTVAP
jgi:hypothetical protein